MKPGLGVGAKAAMHGTVGGEDVIHLGAGGPAGAIVFCTPSMINLMEYAGREVLRPFLEPNEESVGVNVTVEHLAATPVGAAVWAAVLITAGWRKPEWGLLPGAFKGSVFQIGRAHV